jgi:hypothetical protein
MFGRSMPAWHIFQIALCTLRSCQSVADKLAELGLYSGAPSQWRWSADGQHSVGGDGQNHPKGTNPKSSARLSRAL